MEALIKVLLLSMTPVGELRLAIPIGVAVLHLNTAMVFLVAVFGNLIPVLFILFLFKKLSPYFSKKSKTFSKTLNWWEKNATKKHSSKIQKYGFVGLMLLVGVPLPFTGAYTGALLAVLMELPLKTTIPAIFAGIVISGVIVTSLVIFGVNIQDNFELQILLGVLLLFSLCYWYFKNRKRKLSS
jgi:uncharacterized membrane protein